ncbi:hypothetical protein [Streptomyces xiamenensis]|uniref:hypothetical protein n=1 Tax=Streptomyces xiamenensis TaxID=408015 RepID=UPI0037D8C256
MSMNDCEELQYLIDRARADGLSPAEGIEIAAAVERLRDELTATHELAARTHRAYYDLARTLYRREETSADSRATLPITDAMVQAAGVAIERECLTRLGRSLGTAYRDDIAHAALVAARAVASPGARTEQPVGNSMSGGQADTVVQAGTVNGGISTGTHTVINEPTGPVNTGDGAQIVTTYSGTITQQVGQGHAVVGDVHGGLHYNAGDHS